MSADKAASRKAGSTTAEGKKPYQQPELVDYGGIRALTASKGNTGALDNPPFFSKTGGFQ